MLYLSFVLPSLVMCYYWFVSCMKPTITMMLQTVCGVSMIDGANFPNFTIHPHKSQKSACSASLCKLIYLQQSAKRTKANEERLHSFGAPRQTICSGTPLQAISSCQIVNSCNQYNIGYLEVISQATSSSCCILLLLFEKLKRIYKISCYDNIFQNK